MEKPKCIIIHEESNDALFLKPDNVFKELDDLQFIFWSSYHMCS